MKLSLIAKLTLTFTALLIIPLISGYLAYTSILRVQDIQQKMNRQIEAELSVDRINKEVYTMSICLHDYLRSGDKEKCAHFDESRDRLHQRCKEAQGMLPQEDKETLSGIRHHFSRMDVSADQIMAIDEPVGNARAYIHMEQFDYSAIKAQEISAQVREKVEERITAIVAEANTEREKVRERLIVAFLVLIIGPLIAWIAGKNIASPIRNLVDEANRLRAGDWDKEVVPQPTIEIGALSTALEKMRENLVKYRSDVNNYQNMLKWEVETLQKALLPHEIPKIEGLEIAVFYSSATKGLAIGGDFYDFIALPDQRYGLVIGDVSGRGIDAAAYTALARFSLRSVVLENASPANVLRRLNKILIPQTPPGKFITIWYGVWDPDSKTIAFGNGGHLFPVLVHTPGKGVGMLSVSGIALGILESAKYESDEIKLGLSDMLILYTDGLTEARSKDGEFLGEERLLSVAEGLAAEHAQATASKLGSFCIDWAGGKLSDDVAIVVLKSVA